MHLRTADKQFAILAHGDHVEKQKQELINYIKEEESHLVFVEDDLISPTNELKQLGKIMTSDDLEKRLKTILPSNIFFIDNPFNPTKKAVIRIISLYETETICSYERGINPEHSVMQLVTKEVPDIDVISRKKSISRKDMPKSEYVPGIGFVWNGEETRPGYKRIKQIGREIKRGWRTVLIKLLTNRLITLNDIEKVFGSDNTAEWSKFTGKKINIQTWN